MITIKELSAELNDIGQRCTFLGIGPVSENVIRAAFIGCKRHKCPPIFIASRNQVDMEQFGSGYLMGGMDQFKFVKTIKNHQKKIGYDGPVYICRDHGGPWQRNDELDSKCSVYKAMKAAKKSFEADIKAGFNYLHIDPTKCPHKFSGRDLCRWTVELMEHCEKTRKQFGFKPIDYEVGTEDIQGGLADIGAYESFLRELTNVLKKKKLPFPTCIVGQTGTLTRMDKNVGNFNRTTVDGLVKIAKKYGAGLKEHNGDYLSGITCRLHPFIGVAGVNVAPEFGLVETDALIELSALEDKFAREGWIAKDERSGFIDILSEKTFKMAPWRKWLAGEQKKIPNKEIESDKYMRLLIARVCGHYVYNETSVKNAILKLYKNINMFSDGDDAETFVIGKIVERIEFYIRNFNMAGINILKNVSTK